MEKHVNTPGNVDDGVSSNEQFENLSDDKKASFIVENINSDVVLVNLAMWLDLAIAKGRYLDVKLKQNAVSQSDNDKE